jgi:hypothetical protein
MAPLRVGVPGVTVSVYGSASSALGHAALMDVHYALIQQTPDPTQLRCLRLTA